MTIIPMRSIRTYIFSIIIFGSCLPSAHGRVPSLATRMTAHIKNYVYHNPRKTVAFSTLLLGSGIAFWWLRKQTLALNNPLKLSYDVYCLGDCKNVIKPKPRKQISCVPNFDRDAFKTGDEGYRGDEEYNHVKLDYKNFFIPLVFANGMVKPNTSVDILGNALQSMHISEKIEQKKEEKVEEKTDFDQTAFEKFYQDHEWLMSRCPKELQEKFYLYYRDVKKEDIATNGADKVILHRDDPIAFANKPEAVATTKVNKKLISQATKSKKGTLFTPINEQEYYSYHFNNAKLSFDRYLGIFLITFLANQKNFSAYYQGGCVYITNDKVMQGKGKDNVSGSPFKHDLSIVKSEDDTYSEQYNDADELITSVDTVKNNADLKNKMADIYKIHLMPKSDQDILKISEMLMDAINRDQEYAPLIRDFKIVAKLSPDFDENKKRGADIVIYPAHGKENVEKLLNKLITLFKGIEGSDITPRYNIRVNSLIYYAQGHGYDKGKDYAGQYFDANTKDIPKGSDEYALYKPTFEDPNSSKNYYLEISG